MVKKPSRTATGIKAILFDLGNTLYDKELYIKPAFDEVIKYLCKTYYLNYANTIDLFYRIWKVRGSHYEFLLEDLLNILGFNSPEIVRQFEQSELLPTIPGCPKGGTADFSFRMDHNSLRSNSRSIKERVLHIYHHSRPRIKPYPGVEKMLSALKKKYKIALVTDGHPQMQRNKVAALKWGGKFDAIIYTADYSPEFVKPNPFCYKLALKQLNVSPEEAVYVGDNPQEDFKGAKELGIFTVRVLQGEFKNNHLNKGAGADTTIKNICDLTKMLAQR